MAACETLRGVPPAATIGHWGKDGVTFEEYLFWDNGEFMKQIGLAQ